MPISVLNPEIQARLRRLQRRCLKIENVTVLGVRYLRLLFADGDEFYLAPPGAPFLPMIAPENVWLDKEHLASHSHRLPGTSTVYRIRPKENPLGRQVVLKWNRMGQDVPGETKLLFPSAFNSPFEEFALVLELRQTEMARGGWIIPQKPLGIYIPHEVSQPWQLGRKDYLMPDHEEVSIDQSKSYAVIYEWLKGMDLVEAERAGLASRDVVETTTREVDGLLAREGFVVADRKPEHVIVRSAAAGGLRRGRGGALLLGLIDFELLKRAPDYEKLRRGRRRQEYLRRQAHRFEIALHDMPPNLYPMRIFGVDYVYGKAEGTDAELWVVGRDPALFEYFRPEKWRRTPRTKLSTVNQTFYTLTKDDINVVWKVSKVGEVPWVDPSSAVNKEMIVLGFNSPFEEVALARAMNARGISTIYPRAIYMTGSRSQVLDLLADDNRYDSHREERTPLGDPILRRDRDYITIWGYWNGLDQDLTIDDNHHLTPIGAFLAYRKNYLAEEAYLELLRCEHDRIRAAGYEDLNFKGSHLLLSLEAGNLLRDPRGQPVTRVCNFELVRAIPPAATPADPLRANPAALARAPGTPDSGNGRASSAG